MLHNILTLTRPLFIIDTETTGINVYDDRIVEIGFQQFGVEGLIKESVSLIDPQIPIPHAAVAIHGITDALFKTCNKCRRADQHPTAGCQKFYTVPTFAQSAANIAKGLTDCDFGGQNVRFDLQIIQAEMTRAGQAWSYAGARILDSLQLERLAYPRHLGDLYERYTGAKHEGAHSALSDTHAAATVISKQLEMHSVLPKSLDALHALQWGDWADTEGRFRFDNDHTPIVQFGKWKGKPMQDVERSYWNWMGGPKSGFSDEVKQIAREAVAGRFPVKK